MAVRFSASGQTYSSTSGLPSNGGMFSICCWIYLTTDRNAASGVWGLNNSWDINMVTDTDGTTLRLTTSLGDSLGSFALSTATWYRIAVTLNNDAAAFYHSALGSAMTSDSTASFNHVFSPTTWRIGCSASTSNWFNGRIAAFKLWVGAALTSGEVERELSYYTPLRTANLSRFHPFVNAEITDLSGNARTLSGGSGTATEAGPPILWRPTPNQLTIPWDPSTVVWYAVYDTTTGELISTGSIDPRPLPGGQGLKEYINGQPNQALYEWDTTARDFVRKAGTDPIDRVADMIADSSLASVWATLDSTQDTALQNRIGQLLGSKRYRQSTDPIDLD